MKILNEVARMRQLAGINEIKISPPGPQYELFNDGDEDIEIYGIFNKNKCIDFVLDMIIEYGLGTLNKDGGIINHSIIWEFQEKTVTNDIESTKNFIWGVLNDEGVGGAIRVKLLKR